MQIDFSSKNFPNIYVIFRQKATVIWCCIRGVLIEIVGELWGLPCVTIQFLSLFTLPIVDITELSGGSPSTWMGVALASDES